MYISLKTLLPISASISYLALMKPHNASLSLYTILKFKNNGRSVMNARYLLEKKMISSVYFYAFTTQKSIFSVAIVYTILYVPASVQLKLPLAPNLSFASPAVPKLAVLRKSPLPDDAPSSYFAKPKVAPTVASKVSSYAVLSLLSFSFHTSLNPCSHELVLSPIVILSPLI